MHLTLAAALVLTAACERDGDDGPDRELLEQLDHCTDTLERLAQVAAGDRAAALARGCPYACDGLDAYGKSKPAGDPGARQDGRFAGRSLAPLTDGCRFFCSERAETAWNRAEPGHEFAALLETCGRDYYGIPEGHEALLSDTWFVLHRIGEWMRTRRAQLPDQGELRERLDRATAAVHFILPLPAAREQSYELPEARAVTPPRAAMYAVIDAGAVRAAAVRVARLRGGGLEIRPVPGGSFPGEALPGARREAAYRDLVETLHNLHASGSSAAAPTLLLADAELPAVRLLAAAGSLGEPEFELGVAGRSAMAHRVVLERIPEFGSAAPVVELADGHIRVPATDARIALGDDGDALEKALRHLVALRAPLDRIEIRTGPDAVVADLAHVADAASRARIRAMAFSPPAASGAEGGGDP